ncbi:alpha/beta hydrolase [Carnobacterium pleistocenium]|uniref:alpha/beta hydrolase n=1 Tax=Carnobacterium pleistocenium TaxID=181073 RepID=UPI00055093DA|nr:alpha/beta fold hydrolase [Carnobacterium pleistocenium]
MAIKSFFFENGPQAVILMHAYSSTPNDVRMLGRALEKENYTVYAPLFKGHGTKDPEDILDTSPTDWVEDAKEAIQFLLEKGYKKIAIFGLSMGGVIATKMLIDREPIVAGGTFCSPVMNFHRGNNVKKEFLTYVRTLKKKAGYSEIEIEDYMPGIEKKLDDQLDEIGELTQSMETDISEIKHPFFIAQAGQDELIDPQVAFALKAALTQASVVDFHWYENSQHAVTVGVDRKALQEDVSNFLKQLDWNGG